MNLALSGISSIKPYINLYYTILQKKDKQYKDKIKNDVENKL